MKRRGNKVHQKKIVTDKDIAMRFAMKAQQKFDRLIKASILFGSLAKNTSQSKSDIDIVLIIDDASVEWDLELIAWYREELGKLIAAYNQGRDLHINTLKITTWWQDLMHGDPVVLNILRYGEPLIDLGGFFTPIKSLLAKGKIRSTPEAIYASLQRAPTHLVRSKMAEMGAIEGIYWAMVDSAHAALITAGKPPASPEHIPDALQEAFVNTGMLSKGYIRAFSDLFALHKNISHGRVTDVKGADIDKWQEIASKFLDEMTSLVNQIIDIKKDNTIDSNKK